MSHHHHVYSASGAGFLTSGFRRLLVNPERFLAPFVNPGMTVLDVGCGPGFFTIAAAGLVGAEGKVIAADLQQGMLDHLKTSIEGKEISKRIVLHRCNEDRIGVAGPVGTVLALNVVHELPDSSLFFDEMKSIVKPGGTLLLMEPAFIVSAREFGEEISNAAKAGFRVVRQRRKILSRVAVLSR